MASIRRLTNSWRILLARWAEAHAGHLHGLQGHVGSESAPELRAEQEPNAQVDDECRPRGSSRPQQGLHAKSAKRLTAKVPVQVAGFTRHKLPLDKLLVAATSMTSHHGRHHNQGH